MSILSVHWDLRGIWALLSVPGKLYVLCLVGGVAYSMFSSARIGLHLWKARRPGGERRLPLKTVTAITTLRQLHMLLLLLLGLFSANEIFGGIRAIRYSEASLSALGLEVFEPAVGVIFLSFVALMFLHAMQWTVASGVGSVRRDTQPER